MFRNRTLIVVSLAVCAAYTGIGMIVPVRVLYAESRGASLAIIGAMASAFLISNFIFQYPGGWLADHWGRKQVMVLSLLAQAALSLTYLFLTDPIMFVVLRFAEGIAAAAFLPSARALIMDAIPPEKRGEAFGIFSSFFNVGFLLGPAIGGLLAGLGYSAAFIGAVCFRVIALALVIILIRNTVSQKHEASEPGQRVALRELFTLPLIGSYILAFGDFLYVGFDITLMPLWMHDHLGVSVALIGLAYMVWSLPSILISPLGGRIADRRRRSSMILIFGLAQVPLYFIYGLSNLFLLILGLFAVHGIVYSLMMPAVDAHVASASVEKARARIQGLYSAFGLLGGFVGASGFTVLYAWNYHSPLLTIGLVYGTCVLVGGLLIRRWERRKLIAHHLAS